MAWRCVELKSFMKGEGNGRMEMKWGNEKSRR
jgi:hypothetical protein